MKPPIEFSHSSRTYVFTGRDLPKPNPGSYDAAVWTPPDRQLFKVEICDNGCWTIKLCGGQIASGYDAKASKRTAAELIQKHCRHHLEPK